MSNSKSLFALALIALTACQSTNTNVADSNVRNVVVCESVNDFLLNAAHPPSKLYR